MKKILGVGLVLLVAVGSFVLPLWLTPTDTQAPGLPIVAAAHFLPKPAATPATTQLIRTGYAGRVWEVYFHDGQRVRKGQVLLKLAEKLPSVAQQQLQARLRQQEQAYAALAAGPAAPDSVLAAAQEQLADTRAQLARAVPLLSYVFVTAPADGIVSGQLVRIGDYLAAQSPVAQLSSALLTDTTLLLSSVE